MVLHLASPQLCDCLGNKAHHPIVNANKILALHGEIHYHDGIMFQHTADPGKRSPLFGAMTGYDRSKTQSYREKGTSNGREGPHRDEALLVGPLSIKVGFLTTNEYCYVSALTNDMLLGVDFLERHQAVVDFAEHTLTIYGSSITMNNVFPDMVSVSSTENMTILPIHVCMSCRASKSVPRLILLEPSSYTNIMSPRIVCKDSDNIVMSLYNWTD